MHETFEHTADIGLRIHAPDLNRLMEEAAEALTGVIILNPQQIQPRERVDFDVPGDRPDDLLHDWLSQLLYTLDTRHLVFARFEVHRQPAGLTAAAWGERLDTKRHEVGMEVKAVTYHGLVVEQDADGWRAEVILDL
jgi:SHS2 domain-containing protein